MCIRWWNLIFINNMDTCDQVSKRVGPVCLFLLDLLSNVVWRWLDRASVDKVHVCSWKIALLLDDDSSARLKKNVNHYVVKLCTFQLACEMDDSLKQEESWYIYIDSYGFKHELLPPPPLSLSFSFSPLSSPLLCLFQSPDSGRSLDHWNLYRPKWNRWPRNSTSWTCPMSSATTTCSVVTSYTMRKRVSCCHGYTHSHTRLLKEKESPCLVYI